jgi:glucose-1-phosphate adenylyltransferase
VVQASVVLPRVTVGRDCVVQRAILDEGCVLPDGTQIGVDLAADARRFEVTDKGVVLVTPDMLREPG